MFIDVSDKADCDINDEEEIKIKFDESGDLIIANNKRIVIEKNEFISSTSTVVLCTYETLDNLINALLRIKKIIHKS